MNASTQSFGIFCAALTAGSSQLESRATPTPAICDLIPIVLPVAHCENRNDGPGFFANRILAPYINEAGILLDEGVAIDAIDRVPQLGSSAAHVRQELVDKIIDHRQYIRVYGQDMPEIAGWMWQASGDEKGSLAEAKPGVIATAGDNV